MKTPIPSMPDSLLDFIADPRMGRCAPEANQMPACDGGPWPEIGATGAIERQQIEFLAAYSHLNRLHDYLKDVRASGLRENEGPILAGLERAINLRDELEDRYAPIGFYGEPVMDGHLTVNVVFHYAQKYILENHRRHEPLSISAKVPLPEKDLMDKLASVPGIPIDTILADLKLFSPQRRDASDLK